MAADDFDPADLTEVLTVLRTAGIAAETEPEKVRVPGVWLRLDGIQLDQLHALTVRTTVHVITGETDHTRALAATADLFNQVKTALRAAGHELDGDQLITPAGVVLPGSQTALPALAAPLTLHTCQE